MVKIFVRNASDDDTTTLGAASALFLTSILTDVEKNFMLKNLKTIVHANWPDVSDKCVLVLGSTDASVAEIAEAMTSTAFNIEDNVAFSKGQEEVRRIWDVQAPFEGNVENTQKTMREIQWRIPPKGIPVLRGRGLSIYAFNMDVNTAFTDGPTFSTWSKAMGEFF